MIEKTGADTGNSNDQATYHNVFFAHQPIFDSDQKVYCYEIYFRDELDTATTLFSDEEHLQASMEVLANITMCPDKNLRQARIIINFPPQALLNKIPYSLHRDKVIIQVPDRSEFPAGFIEEVRLCKASGYTFSIDDYQAHPHNEELYTQADFLTLSVHDQNKAEIDRLLMAMPELSATFLAKKIENQAQFLQTRKQGFSLFQGYFFKLPKTEIIRKIPSCELLRFEILEQLSSPELDFDTLTSIIAKDVSLSLRLINLLNSPFYGLVQQIHSLKQALIYVGLSQLRQWLRVILFTDLAQPMTTKELTRVSLLRAKFMESVSSGSMWQQQHDQLFLLGLFSLLDAIFQVPMKQITGYLAALDNNIRRTLEGEQTELTSWLHLADSMENSDWDKVGMLSATLDLDSYEIMKCYASSLQWANHALAGNSH